MSLKPWARASSLPTIVDPRVVFAALTGAMAWNIITWALGIPSSSSHALIGGLVGAGVAKAGIKAIVWGGLAKTTAAIVLSPLTGFFLALLIFLIASWVFVRYTPFAVDRLFRSLQLRLRFALFHRSRRERCPENHGHHRGAALFAGLSGR